MGDSDRAVGAPAYLYATTLLRGRSRFTLGLPRLTPPDRRRNWELCGVSHLAEGLLVSWRCLSTVAPSAKDGA